MNDKRRSGYADDFLEKIEREPPFSFYQEARLSQKEDKQNYWSFSYSFPTSLNRKRDSLIPIAPGFETFFHRQNHHEINLNKQNNEEKEDEETEPVQPKQQEETKTEELFPDIPNKILEEIVNLATYTPSSHIDYFRKPSKKHNIATNPAVMPFRRNHTPVEYKPIIYNEKPQTWQKVGCIWDKAQERNSLATSTRRTADFCRLLSTAGKEKVKTPPQTVSSETLKPSTEKYFPSTIPGYGGYQPRLPHRLSNKERFPQMQSSTWANYKTYPNELYRLPKYPVIAPLSRTITLTQPCNPFNKISQDRLTIL